MKKYISFGVATLASLFIFSTAHAQTATDATSGINNFASLITTVNSTVIKAAGTLFMSLAVVAFFFGIVEYIWGLRQGDSTKTKNGNQFMIWGLVALFVMFSVYGIVKFWQGVLFNGQNVNTIAIPTITTGGTGGASGSATGGSGTGGAADPLTGGSGTGSATGGTGTGGDPCSTGGQFGHTNAAGTCIPD